MPASTLVGERVKTLLDVRQLFLQFIEIGIGGGLFRRDGRVRWRYRGADEGRKHGQRLRKSREILAGQFFDRVERRIAERRGSKSAPHFVAKLLLFPAEAVDRKFQIARQERLYAVAIKADQLAQESRRQQRLPFLSLLLE